MKQLIMGVMGWLIPCMGMASVQVGLEYATEMQTDFKRGVNWVNMLRASLSLPLSQRLSVEAATISIAETRAEPLLADLQTFSNIEETNPAGLCLAGGEMGVGQVGLLHRNPEHE